MCIRDRSTAWTHPKGVYFRPNGLATDGKVVALFSGQGSQYVGMGKAAANAFPQILETFQQCDALFKASGQTSLSQRVFPKPVFSKEAEQGQLHLLTQTQNAQPAIGTFSMGLYRVFQDAGFKANFTAGHSFGELTALWAAGVYDDATFLALAKARGAAMATQNPGTDMGSMLAIKAPVEQVEAEVKNLEGVQIANVNSTSQVVLGGSTAAIQNAQNSLKEKGYKVVALPVSAAFHTAFVEHAQQPFAEFVATQKFKSAKTPVYSNTTASTYPKTPAAIKRNLQNQILNPVLFKNEVEKIYEDGGRIFVEFGPKGVLTNLVKNILKGQDFEAIAVLSLIHISEPTRPY